MPLNVASHDFVKTSVRNDIEIHIMMPGNFGVDLMTYVDWTGKQSFSHGKDSADFHRGICWWQRMNVCIWIR